MYYAITPYVLAVTALTTAALLISSLYLLRFARSLKTDQAPLYIAFTIMLSVSVFTSIEVILHLAIQKHPASWAILASLTIYLITTSSLLSKLTLKFNTRIAYITGGTAIFLASCLPTFLWLSCATGTTCI